MVRILFLADSHLGFDLPVRPRIRRRRRGHDFFANYERALAPALAGCVDLVVHGGDVLHRSQVPTSLVHQAFEPLKRVADAGVPVFVVPGNHERARVPHARFAVHPGIHLFDRPRTFSLEVRGGSVSLAGFPFQRRDVRGRFSDLLAATEWGAETADIRLLCVHQCVEGATVGPADFTFRNGRDVIRGRDLPGVFAAVLSGHIHRHQVLTEDLRGRPIAAPVFYPGSIERTSIAEKDEAKGYIVMDLEPAGGGSGGGRIADWSFESLPARPMLVHEMMGDDPIAVERGIRRIVEASPRDAVLRIRVRGRVGERARAVLAAANLRALAPPTMNLDAVLVDDGHWRGRGRRRGRKA
jgi:exonuclease SbcD